MKSINFPSSQLHLLESPQLLIYERAYTHSFITLFQFKSTVCENSTLFFSSSDFLIYDIGYMLYTVLGNTVCGK